MKLGHEIHAAFDASDRLAHANLFVCETWQDGGQNVGKVGISIVVVVILSSLRLASDGSLLGLLDGRKGFLSTG